MRNLFLGAIAALAFIAPVAAEAAPAAAAAKLNETCCCGKPGDAKADAVSIKVGEADKKIAVCSKECAEAVKKMDPKEAWKATEAHNKKADAPK